VVRVSPSIVLSDLFQLAVERKDLDPGRHELRHPTQPDVVLDLGAPLSQYAVTEVTIVEKPPPHHAIASPPHGEWVGSVLECAGMDEVIVTPLSTIPVDSGVTNLIHDRRSCVDFTLEVEANVARCVH